MNDSPLTKDKRSPSDFVGHIDTKAQRKLKARRKGAHSVWLGLGTMGLIGWSVAVPALLGAALGTWLDKRSPGAHSWTLALLVGGLTIGCLSAWHWVANEERAMRDDENAGDE